MRLVISGYGEKEVSIALFEIDLNKKNFVMLDSDKIKEPSFATYSKINNRDFIFTYEKEPLSLLMYEIVGDKLECVDKMIVPGTTLTHLYFDKEANRLYCCSYKNGSFMYVNVNEGRYGNYRYIEKTKPALCHCVFPENDLIDIIDFANDEILCYDKDLRFVKRYEVPRGVGPRHGIYYKDKIYIITERSNQIYVINPIDGKILQTISTLNSDIKSYGATLFTIDNHLYASNRGEETIAKFSIKNELQNINSFLYFGKNSRHMIKSLDEKYLISCNKDSNDVTIVSLDKENLVLTIPFIMPSCAIDIN